MIEVIQSRKESKTHAHGISFDWQLECFLFVEVAGMSAVWETVNFPRVQSFALSLREIWQMFASRFSTVAAYSSFLCWRVSLCALYSCL